MWGEALPATGPRVADWRQRDPFGAFADWRVRFEGTPPRARAALESEGRRLAQARLRALADLIQADPAEALRRSLPGDVRGSLPETLRPLVEFPVHTRAAYEVYGVLRLEGSPGPGMVRLARAGDREYLVFASGDALEHGTHPDRLIEGIAVPVAAASAPPAVPGAAPTHLLALDPRTVSWVDAGDDPPVAASSRTEGRKRFMVFRVDFPDYAGEVMTTNQALTLVSVLSDFMAQMSYGQFLVAPVGEGSVITPTMRLPNAADSYQHMGALLDACWAAAGALGFERSGFDDWFVCTAGKPAAGFAGLAYVGSEGFWLANRYWDVRTAAHELGHNLNLHHANWWNTGGRSMLGEGTVEEYGDPFDTMSSLGGGIRHFSAYNKNRTDWIPDSDCPRISGSGRYRLYAHDMGVPFGVRGLWFDRPSGGDYWLEFRQLWTANKALMNGVSLRWAGGSTTLLDFTPGSAGGKDDHAITIGRTFSDTNVALHITPIGKGHTHPESIDLIVHVGPFPDNHPPVAALSASLQTASSGQTLRFLADATDPDGDALAYSWDFGDGNYSTDNSPSPTHVFTDEGEYVVHCAVSDMKGGLAREALVVRIDAPLTATIRGRVLGTNGLPMAGAKVFVGSSRYAFTGSDGTYTLSRLEPGTYTVVAIEPVHGAHTFLAPVRNNPITVPPDVTDADFIAFHGPPPTQAPLVRKQAVWKYLDQGSVPGMGWNGVDFDDAAWGSGPSPLGYPGNEVSTLLSYGADPSHKPLAYYFRKRFTVPSPAAYTNLLLEVRRDDGVVLYLNGVEILRDNMPDGAVSHDTLASDTVSGGEETSYQTASVDAALLGPGDNVLAAEVHQAAPDSSDLAFDLALYGQSATNLAPLNLVYVAFPENRQSLVTPLNLPLNAIASSLGDAVTQVNFYADGAWLSSDTNPPYAQSWFRPALGSHTVHVVAAFASGAQITSAPVRFDVVTSPPKPLTQPLVTLGAFWNYYAGPAGAPAGWAERSYDDSGWPGGFAELGYGDEPPDETTAIPYGDDAADKWITTCFRHAFVLNDPRVVTNLVLQLKRDDGALVYLNGREILRDEMPEGAVTAQTLARRAVLDDGKEVKSFALDPAPLVLGTNVLAVEIHQSMPNSSDLSFDAALTAWIASNRPPGVWLASPAPGSVVFLPSPALLEAHVATAPGTALATLQFYDGPNLLGETASQPFAWTWHGALGGWHVITAVATDTAGTAFTSAPVAIVAVAPPLTRALVSFGEPWHYWDEGTDPGPAWAEADFPDASWNVGPGRLGYGRDGEITTLRSGPDPEERHLTACFRRRFTNECATAFAGLRLRLIRDDGAAVYLDGVECFRTNLPPGPIGIRSLATQIVSGADETTPVEVVLSRPGLAPGVHVIAVEMHQAALTSSDLGFDLELTGLIATNSGNAIYLVSPPAGARFTAPAPVPLAAYARASHPIARVDFFEGGTLLAQAAASPYTVAWNDPPLGSHTLVAVATDTSGARMTSGPLAFVVGPPAAPIAPVAASCIPAGAQWSFWDSPDPVGTGWHNPAFQEHGWSAGWARFGWGLDGELTLLTAGRVTHYFRRWFVVEEPAALTELVFALACDDGAIVRLNGREVFRVNLPDGAPTPYTTALAAVNPPAETLFLERCLSTAASGLVSGSNLVAVELHQHSATSSDAGFDLELTARGTTEARIYLASPPDHVLLNSPGPVWIEAMAQPPAGATASRVEFFIDGVRAGESFAAPYRCLWVDPALGTHQLEARLTDSRGVVLDAAPRTVVVGPEPVTATLIARHAVWHYLDTGVNLGAAWADPAYDHSAWPAGPARLGYGNDGEVTVLGYGPNPDAKPITVYFRRTFVAPAGAIYTNLVFQLQRDDGAVVWLNGVELFRSNLPQTPVDCLTLASIAASGSDEQTFFPATVAATALRPGTNLLAVEIHQVNDSSSDLGFDLELVGQGFVDLAVVPLLTVTTDDGYLELSWPETPVAWHLLTAAELHPGPGGWTPVPVAPVTAGGRHVVALRFNGLKAFYRLAPP
ncbi:MAG: PKD domain-containing protein [Verrucomicrobia bacterium]|nr:PKD domain-containing protein [Verrucomicrobiota bacterium]